MLTWHSQHVICLNFRFSSSLRTLVISISRSNDRHLLPIWVELENSKTYLSLLTSLSRNVFHIANSQKGLYKSWIVPLMAPVFGNCLWEELRTQFQGNGTDGHTCSVPRSPPGSLHTAFYSSRHLLSCNSHLRPHFFHRMCHAVQVLDIHVRFPPLHTMPKSHAPAEFLLLCRFLYLDNINPKAKQCWILF